MRMITLLTLALVITSCGRDDENRNGTATFGPFTATHADQFIQGIKSKTTYRPGQTKMIYQSKEHKISSSTYCDYWEDRTISVVDVDTNTIEVEMTAKTSLMTNEPAACPQRISEDVTKSNTFTIAEYEKTSTEFIKYYIDHNYRCSQNSACATSRFIKSEDTQLKGVPVKLITTEYTYKDGEVGVLNTWVSTRSLFEGVLAYKMINKQTEKWWMRRGFISSHQ